MAPPTARTRSPRSAVGASPCRRCSRTRCSRHQLDLYRETCAANGTEPDIVWIHACHLDEDRDTAIREGRDWINGFIQGNCSPLTEYEKPDTDGLIAAGYGFYTAGIMEQLAEVPYEQLIEEDYVWVGTPDDIIARIEETIGVCEGLKEIGITVNAGGAPHWMAIKNQELFAERVIPHFKGAAAAAAQAGTASTSGASLT